MEIQKNRSARELFSLVKGPNTTETWMAIAPKQKAVFDKLARDDNRRYTRELEAFYLQSPKRLKKEDPFKLEVVHGLLEAETNVQALAMQELIRSGNAHNPKNVSLFQLVEYARKQRVVASLSESDALNALTQICLRPRSGFNALDAIKTIITSFPLADEWFFILEQLWLRTPVNMPVVEIFTRNSVTILRSHGCPYQKQFFTNHLRPKPQAANRFGFTTEFFTQGVAR